MKRKLLLFILILPLFSFAQKGEEGKTNLVTITGFIKSDMFYDTRKVNFAREGHFLFFPLNEKLTTVGFDENSTPSFNMLAIQSRIGVKIAGPDKNDSKFKKTGVIEGDFFGQANDNINLFRLRHAYFTIGSKHLEFLFGQYWIPMFIPSCSPNTISFNTGSPIQPFGRNPQARMILKFGGFNLTGIVSSQRDNSNIGIGNIRSGSYLSNAAMPEVDAQFSYERDNATSGTALALGLSGGYKKILPATVTSKGYKSEDFVKSYMTMAYMKIKIPEITVKIMGIYGQDLSDVLSIGGFAVTNLVDTAKGYIEYSPLTTMSVWGEFHTNGKKLEIGVFGGYSQNMGTEKEIVGETYGFGTDIKSLFRVAPRIVLMGEKIKFAFETEYTSATYGTTTATSKGIPTENNKTVKNIRYLLAVYYLF